jgi:2-dehydropantoate 2-reductase
MVPMVDRSDPSAAPTSKPAAGCRILVVGCGGIGGIVAAHLSDLGQDVTALTKNQQIAAAVAEHGFRVRGESSPGTVRGRVVIEVPSDDPPFDFILLATQPPQVEEAARATLPLLARDGRMVCFQNGLCEERVATIAGAPRVIGAIVAWGASMVEPGIYDRTSPGGFSIGRLAGPADARTVELARVLEAVGPTSLTDNLSGARWSKLAINCAISSLGTVGGDRLGALMRHRFVRRLALEIMTEAVEVARAEGVTLEKVSGTLDLDWIVLSPADRISGGSPSLVAKHALLLAVGARYRRLRSSMLAAIERGRPPAVGFLNGEVIERGLAHGIPTPINTAVRDEVLTIADRRAAPGVERLRALFDATR